MNLLDNQNDLLEFDENKNYLEELVGDDKKFKDPEALAKGKYLGDLHNKALERDLNELREDFKKLSDEYKSGQTAKELLDQLRANQGDDSTNRDNTNRSNENEKPQFDPKEVESLVSSKIQQYEQSKKELENFNLVQAKVRERFGNTSKDVLKQKAEELNLSDDDVNRLARSNPNLFFKTFDLNEQHTDGFQAPPRSERRSDNFAPRGSEKRTQSYYDKMRRDNPLLYHDPKIRLQMEKDSQALGMDFFDV